MITEDEFYYAWSRLSTENIPPYVDTSDKNHRWLGKRVKINFEGEGNTIYPAVQKLYVTKVDMPYINLSRKPKDNGNFIIINIDDDYEIYKQIRNQLDYASIL